MVKEKRKRIISRIVICIIVAMQMMLLVSCMSEDAVISVTEDTKDKVLENTLKKYVGKPQFRGRFKGDVPRKAASSQGYAGYEMPDINAYSPSVKGKGKADAELFLLSEGSDGLLSYAKETAEEFNSKNLKTGNGKTASVTVRPIDASLGMDFIATGSYVPDGCIAVNTLAEDGCPAMASLAGYFAGDEMVLAVKADKDKGEDGKDILESVKKGSFSILCPSPANNPTGLNFLSALKEKGMLEEQVFQDIQDNITYAGYYSQIAEAGKTGGADAIISSRQQLEEAGIKKGYVLYPVGVAQDHPVYITGKDSEKAETIKLFMDFVSGKTGIAEKHGFTKPGQTGLPEKYDSPDTEKTLAFWKKNKGGTRDVVAVFVADVSGSMEDYGKYDALISSLRSSMQYIDEESTVGLISYNNWVAINHMPAKFTKEEQEYFSGGINDIVPPQGGTASYNALLEAVKLIRDEELSGRHKNGIKPAIILLSDGISNSGLGFDNIKDIVKAFGYKVYTIGYGKDADTKTLEWVAKETGGSFVWSTSDDIPFVIKTLFTNEL